MQKNLRRTTKLMFLPLLLGLLGSCALIRINTPDVNEATGTVGSDTQETAAPGTAQPTTDIKADDVPRDPEEDGRNALAALRDHNLDASTLLVATTDTSHAFVNASDLLRNETVYAERMERIKWVEEKYNVRLVFFTYTEEGLYDEIAKAQKSDTQYVADYYAIPATMLGAFEANDFLMNLRTLPFTDYTQPYFDASAMEQMSAGHAIYSAVGDFTRAYDALDAVYFNKDLTSADLYKAVENGTWTWDMYFTLATEATRTEEGHSGDNLGLLSLSDVELSMWGSSGIHPVSSGFHLTPTLSTAPEIPDMMQKMADLLYTNVYKKTTTLPVMIGEGTDNGEWRFENGISLFYHGDLAQMYRWSDISVNWGILPLPKLDAAQTGYTSYAYDTTVFCVPSTTVESDKSGLVLQALFASSYNAYKDMFLSDALAYHIRDGRTADMLDIIVSSVGYDFSAMFASGYKEIAASTTGALHGAVTTKNDALTLFERAKAATEAMLPATFPTYP